MCNLQPVLKINNKLSYSISNKPIPLLKFNFFDSLRSAMSFLGLIKPCPFIKMMQSSNSLALLTTPAPIFRLFLFEI